MGDRRQLHASARRRRESPHPHDRGRIEPQLDPRAFIRIHRRYIVNVDRIVEVQPWFAGDAIVVLRNGAKLRLSRTYRERLHARLGARNDAAEDDR